MQRLKLETWGNSVNVFITHALRQKSGFYFTSLHFMFCNCVPFLLCRSGLKTVERSGGKESATWKRLKPVLEHSLLGSCNQRLTTVSTMVTTTTRGLPRFQAHLAPSLFRGDLTLWILIFHLSYPHSRCVFPHRQLASVPAWSTMYHQFRQTWTILTLRARMPALPHPIFTAPIETRAQTVSLLCD